MDLESQFGRLPGCKIVLLYAPNSLQYKVHQFQGQKLHLATAAGRTRTTYSYLAVLQVEHVRCEHADPQAGREVAVQVSAYHILILNVNIPILN